VAVSLCVYCTKLEPIFKICNVKRSPHATRLYAKHRAFQEWKVQGTHTHSARRVRRQSRKKNTPCIYDLAGVKFFLKKERVFFFRGSTQEVSGSTWGFNADEVCF